MPLGDKPLCNSTDTHNERQNYDFTHCKDYVEGVSKLSFQCGSRDAKFCVSTTGSNKLLIFNILYTVMGEGVSKCDFAMSRDVACRISMFATTYKTFNINSLFNQIVETQNFASLLPH